MKRSLCLLLALLLAVGALAPAARAEAPQQITVICKNWDRLRPVTAFRFQIREPGVQLVEQPRFFYLDENNQRVEDVGLLDPVEYFFVIRLRMEQAPAAKPDVTVNGHRPDTITLEGNEVICEYRTESFKSYYQLSVPGYGIGYGQSTDCPIDLAPGLTCETRVHKGATPDAPVIEDGAAEVFQDGQSYLFEVTFRPERLGARLEGPFSVYDDPLVYCKEWTEYNVDGNPDQARIYLRYDCTNNRMMTVSSADGFYASYFLEDGTQSQDGSVHVGDRVTVRGELNREDYDFLGWEVNGIELTEEQLHSLEFSFPMPGNTVMVRAVTRRYEFPFADVHQKDWFYEDVMIAHRIGLINGLTDTTFGPRKTCTRAQFLSILGRFVDLGSYEPEGSLPFRDVPVNAWYYKAVHLFYTAGLVSGKTDTSFGPYDPITRAEAVTMIWRLLDKPEAQGNPASFKDVSRKAYYYDAVRFAVEAGIVKGVGGGCFAPNQPVTRAQTAAMTVRMLELLTAEMPAWA